MNILLIYPRQTQEKDQKYQVEIHELTQTNASLQNDNAELNRIIQAQQKIIEGFLHSLQERAFLNKNSLDNKKEIKKLRRDLDDIKLEDEDYVQKMQAAKNEVAHINSEKEAAVKSSRHYEAKCINLEEQIHELKQSLETAQNNYITTSAALEELRKQHNLKSASYHQQINE